MLLILMMSLVLPGCGIVAAGLAAGIYAALDDDEDTKPPLNRRPSAPFISRCLRRNADVVTVDYELEYEKGGAVELTFEWRGAPITQSCEEGGDPCESGEGRCEDAIGYFPIRGSNGQVGADDIVAQDFVVNNDGTQTIWLEAGKRTPFRLTWEARPDIREYLTPKDAPLARIIHKPPTALVHNPGLVSVACVCVRISVLEPDGEEAVVGESEAFTAGNDPPSVKRASAEDGGGVISLEVTLTDTSCDDADLEVEFAFPGEEYQDATIMGSTRDLGTSTGGVPYKLGWISVADAPDRRGRVTLRIRARDFEEGDYAYREFEVDNNYEPQVQIVDVASSSDRSHEIPIRFIVRDQEEDPVSVILQWAFENDDFATLPSDLEDRPGYLEQLLSDPALENERTRFHILSGATVPLKGVIDRVDFAGGVLQECDFVRQGLVFVPPSQDGPEPLPECPNGGASCQYEKNSRVALVGRQIDFLRPATELGGEKVPLGSATIDWFDPRTSTAGFEPLSGLPDSGGVRYEIGMPLALYGLPSTGEEKGVLYTFLWDSSKDLGSIGDIADAPDACDGTGHSSYPSAALTSRIKLRAIGIDEERGPSSFASVFDLESGSLVEGEVLEVATGSQQVLIFDLSKHPDSKDILILGAADEPQVQFYLQQSDSPPFTSTPYDSFVPFSENEDSGARLVTMAVGKLNEDDLIQAHLAIAEVGDSSRIGIYAIRDDTSGGEILAELEKTLTLEGEIVDIAFDDVYGDMNPDLIVTRSIESAGASIAIYENKAGLLENEPVILNVQGEPSSIPTSLSIGDINGDGKQDIVIACEKNSEPGTIHTFTRFPGTPPFQYQRAEVDTGGPLSVMIGPPSAGGMRTILVASKASDSITIFDHDLAPLRCLQTDPEPLSLSVGDFNGDGLMDVAVIHQSGTLGVYLRHSPDHKGKAQTQQGVLPSVFSFSVRIEGESSGGQVVVDDLNDDGRDDIVLLTKRGVNVTTANIHYGISRGAVDFSNPRFLARRRIPHSLSIGDVNGDNRSDIVVANLDPSSLSVLEQSSMGTFPSKAVQGETPVPEIECARGGRLLAIGDVDGDGKNDIAVGSCESRCITFWSLDATQGTYQEMMHPAKIQLNGKPTHLKIGDLNGDGRNDVITVLDRGVKVIHIHYQDESHSLTDTFELALEASEHANVSLALGDMDGNGSNDMLVTNSTSGKVLCYYQDRAIGLELRHILEPEIQPEGGGIADLNSDGVNDVVVYGGISILVYYLRPDPDGNRFPSTWDRESIDRSRVVSMAIGDVSGDGLTDLMAYFFKDSLKVFYQSPTGVLGVESVDSNRFLSNRTLGVSDAMESVIVDDINGDMQNDVIGLSPTDGTLILYMAR